MNILRVIVAGGLVAALPAWAVYAPVPDQDQGKALTVSARAGVTYDTNIFGAATDAIASSVAELAPKIAYNASVTDRTFLALSYQLTLDDYARRPGEKLLDSHDVMARVAHAFSPATTLDVTEIFSAARNPESLLNGLPINADQSLKHDELDASFTTPAGAKATVTVKDRAQYFGYRNPVLARDLDHIENLAGLSGDYAVLPSLKAVGEYRRQDVYYRKLGETKNKDSDFLMAGVDYKAAQKLTATARLGAESRRRAGAKDITVPYAELTAKYDYAEDSFLSAGYTYTIEEASNVDLFTDSKVNRVFVSAQHHVTALIVASGSVTYDSSILQGRVGQVNVSESGTRAGVALSYLPRKNWTIAATCDSDHIRSDDPARAQRRARFGVNASYAF